jgi:hypothetical protein
MCSWVTSGECTLRDRLGGGKKKGTGRMWGCMNMLSKTSMLLLKESEILKERI